MRWVDPAIDYDGWRRERLKPSAKEESKYRTPFERDRDRILYSSAFRRLGGVTQVVAAKEEGHLFHNRLTHSLKVAQLARRLAQKILIDARDDTSKKLSAIVSERGGLDADVAEAAGLGHDLGHPPFGHIAEEELHYAICHDLYGGPERNDDDRPGPRPKPDPCKGKECFQGNAQSFRVVTRLTHLDLEFDGLNLTRATLNALSKYPWGASRGRSKYGIYKSDRRAFAFAQFGACESPLGLKKYDRTLEAEIMDWADDIAYAVHDVEDFYRAGLIPLGARLDDAEQQEIFRQVKEAWDEEIYGATPTNDELNLAFDSSWYLFTPKVPFHGTGQDRARLREFSSTRIDSLFKATELGPEGLTTLRSAEPKAPARTARVEVEFLKGLNWYYVIRNAGLATQQHGQRKVVRELYWTYRRALAGGEEAEAVFPPRLRGELKTVKKGGLSDLEAARIVADVVAGMTESQAIRVHQRFGGLDFGPLLDPAVL